MSDYPIDNRPGDVILDTDPIAIEGVTEVIAYRDRKGCIHPVREQAVYCNTTHRVCDGCGKVATEKYYTHCRGCRDLRTIERWEAIATRKAWDHKAPIVCILTDVFVQDECALDEWFENHPSTDPCFVECVRMTWNMIDEADIAEVATDDEFDGEIPEAARALIKQANEILADNPPDWWEAPHPSSYVAVEVRRDN